MPSKMEVAPQCTQKLRWRERWSGFENFLLFWFSGIFRKFSKKIEFSRILEKFHFSISISMHFHFTFHFSKRVNQIFISLFTSRTFNIHSRRTLEYRSSAAGCPKLVHHMSNVHTTKLITVHINSFG